MIAAAAADDDDDDDDDHTLPKFILYNSPGKRCVKSELVWLPRTTCAYAYVFFFFFLPFPVGYSG